MTFINPNENANPSDASSRIDPILKPLKSCETQSCIVVSPLADKSSNASALMRAEASS
jgi:hypothetical protein